MSAALNSVLVYSILYGVRILLTIVKFNSKLYYCNTIVQNNSIFYTKRPIGIPIEIYLIRYISRI